jgi:hypothetical protein
MRGNSGSDQENMTTNDIAEPANLRLLRRLVTALMVVMILGLLSLVGLIVIRFATAPQIQLPEAITLPDGVVADAFTQGRGWYAVVTRDQHILIFDAGSGQLHQDIPVTLPE